MVSLIPYFVWHYLGVAGFGDAVNKGMYRVSIVCKKRGCPNVMETRNVDVQGELKHN